MEDTEPMDVDDSSPQGAKEDPNVCNAINRKFLENVQCCTTTLKTQDVATVLKPINGVLNSGGGIVEIKIDGFSKLTPKDLNKHLDTFWSALQPKLNLMVQPSAYADIFDQEREKDTIRLFIRATEHFCTVDYNLYLPGDAGLLLPLKQKVVDLLSERDSSKKKTDSPQVPLTDLNSLVPEQFKYEEVLNFHESKQVQLKYYPSKKEFFRDNNQKAQYEIAKHISSFGNGIGGVILIGIKNNGEVRGQSEETGSKKKLEGEFNKMVKEMSKTWSFTPTQGIHWDVTFVPVTGAEEPRSVIAILIAGMQNLGGIFTKCPKSFELQVGSGSGGAEKVVLLNFSQWKQRMLKDTCKGESKGTREEMRKFRLVKLLDGPLLTVQGSVEEIVEEFFPVRPKCQVVPKGFVSNLPEEAKQVIRKIQEQITNGLLVASPSMLSAVQKEELRKEDGVICDLLLLSESLGRLHLISLVRNGSQDQFFPHARATAKAVKKSLVRNGGCYEKFYITCQVVLCNRVGTEPFEIPPPDSPYPEEYHLRSSPQELVKINRILQSLVIVLAQVPSFLSNKQGLSFLNLLTKEQFQLLYNEIDEHRELWIRGVGGTGKTVVAVEFMRELLRRDPNLRPANILYVCHRPGMLSQIRKLELCECRTQEAFVEDSFPEIWHVILDEVQNFQAKDRNWLQKARELVEQSKSIHGRGYLWCFMDKGQCIYKGKSVIPESLPQTFTLRKVIRNSKRIFDYAATFLDRRIWGSPQSDVSQGKLVTIGHDFDGEQITLGYLAGERITRLIKALESLLEEGYSKGDIAVLCFSAPLEDNELKQLQKFTSTVSAERNDEDSIVLSTVTDYGGLERPVVIIVGESFAPNSTMMFNRLRYCARTRAMVKLVTLYETSKGRKRKESN